MAAPLRAVQVDPPAPPPPLPSRPRWAAPLGAWNALVLAAWLIGPFLAAGTARWSGGWFHLASAAIGLAAHQVWVARHNPALRQARRRPGPGTKGWDVAWNALVWPLFAAVALTAGADYRTHGATLPPLAGAAGLVVLAAGLALSASAMSVNPFFEGTVRLQRERDQRVIEVGPYRLIRHPGNLGLAVWAAASPLLLRSATAAWAAGAAVAWVVLRTALEDATLRRELPGYQGYCGRTRFRLVPGVW